MTQSSDTDRPSSNPNDVPNASYVPDDDTLPNIPEQRRPRDYLLVSLKGVAMGACDVIPGVSGGTMALILGIYEELIESLHTLGQPSFLAAVVRLRVREVFARLNWRFLLAPARRYRRRGAKSGAQYRVAARQPRGAALELLLRPYRRVGRDGQRAGRTLARGHGRRVCLWQRSGRFCWSASPPPNHPTPPGFCF
ncbi:MAG: DUF368 domain-containing protein [Trueperaceae bacterium]|nr:DUF368 domain-containing protein [Trueperaceae bacterium]